MTYETLVWGAILAVLVILPIIIMVFGARFPAALVITIGFVLIVTGGIMGADAANTGSLIGVFKGLGIMFTGGATFVAGWALIK